MDIMEPHPFVAVMVVMYCSSTVVVLLLWWGCGRGTVVVALLWWCCGDHQIDLNKNCIPDLCLAEVQIVQVHCRCFPLTALPGPNELFSE